MWLIDAGVDAHRTVVLPTVLRACAARPDDAGRAACPGCGRCGRRCTSPITFAGMSIRGNDLPTTVYCADRLRDALTRRRRDRGRRCCVDIVTLNSLPPIRSPYVTVLPPPEIDALARRSGSRPGRRASSRPCSSSVWLRIARPPRGSSVDRLEMPRAAAAAARDVQPRLGVRVDHLRACPCSALPRRASGCRSGCRDRARSRRGVTMHGVVRRDRDPRVDLRRGPAGSRRGRGWRTA